MRSMRAPIFISSASAIVIAAIASTTTTARGTIIGSWRPLMEISISSPDLFTVCCVAAIEGVGFMAALKISGEPSVMPPRVPPEWFVSFETAPSLIIKASLFVSPVAFAASKPSPISKPFTAPIDIIAFARLASIFSNTGSPSPTGRPVMTHSHTPPEELRDLRHSSRYSEAFSAASASGI